MLAVAFAQHGGPSRIVPPFGAGEPRPVIARAFADFGAAGPIGSVLPSSAFLQTAGTAASANGDGFVTADSAFHFAFSAWLFCSDSGPSLPIFVPIKSLPDDFPIIPTTLITFTFLVFAISANFARNIRAALETITTANWSAVTGGSIDPNNNTNLNSVPGYLASINV
jgi:hypothetical protein